VQIETGETLLELVERLEPKKDYAFTEGDGRLIRTASISDSEAWENNNLLKLMGSGRRWMERGN
jgi:hypothetical protein